jgi:hypothetical protein
MISQNFNEKGRVFTPVGNYKASYIYICVKKQQKNPCFEVKMIKIEKNKKIEKINVPFEVVLTKGAAYIQKVLEKRGTEQTTEGIVLIMAAAYISDRLGIGWIDNKLSVEEQKCEK